MSWIGATFVVILTVFAMEVTAWAAHKYVMHGFGWGWHRSHHEPHDHALEKNDLYAVVFAVLAMILMTIGHAVPAVFWIGMGLLAYGVLYFLLHDVLVHQRWPFRHIPHNGYMKRLVQAHRLHHAVHGRDGGVSFGFLYAKPVKALRAELLAQSRSISNGDA